MKTWGPAWNMLPSKDAFVFVDNHDNQRSDNSNILTYKSRQRYIMAVAFMLSNTYGIPRVMSSFEFNAFDQGRHCLISFISYFFRIHNTLIQSIFINDATIGSPLLISLLTSRKNKHNLYKL